MIAGLHGRLYRKGADHLVIDVGGVRYACYVSLPTLIEAGEVGEVVDLTIHTHVREDALLLYGFLDESEKAVFLALLGISGIGPKLALTLLSGLPANELAQVIVSGDVARLTRVPGVGKKTAERIVVELRDRLAKLMALAPEPIESEPVLALADELASALGNLGYKPKQIAGLVEKLAKDAADGTPLETLIRMALKELSR